VKGGSQGSIFSGGFLYVRFLCPRPIVGALSDDARLTSYHVSLTVAYIGPKSITQRPNKIGTEVAHVTCDSDITFKVKRSKVNLQGAGDILWRSSAQLVTRACNRKISLIDYSKI